MPRILIGELLQIVIYITFAIFIKISKFKKPLFVGLGFVVAVAVPSILVGFGVPGIRGVNEIGNTSYETFRSLPVANGIWGIFHLTLAAAIYSKIRDNFRFGWNLGTLLIAIGFCLVFIPLSIRYGMNY
ncbi:MAG: hypothetical protein JW866_04125 [Ignavibacteriales bacterium]|nr:hypothetical protein [Ignavibacteriales bacterium]